MQPFDWVKFLTSIQVAASTVLLAVGSCLNTGCSDAKKMEQVIAIAQQSESSYNVTVGGTPGFKLVGFGQNIGFDFGTTATANVSGTFANRPLSPAVPAEIVSQWQAVADDLKVLLDRVAAVEKRLPPAQ